MSVASETINGFPLVANAAEAFRQTAWNCGRIDDCRCPSAETRLAHLELAVGYEVLKEEHCMLESYVGGTIATGNRPRAKFVFEPIVGNNDHHGVFWGNRVGLEVWHHDSENQSLWVYFDYTGRFLFRRGECRLVDVKCKPWSRYMQLYLNQEQAQQAFDLCNDSGSNEGTVLYTPGPNVFCLNLCVSPRFSHTFSSAFTFRCNGFEGEAGYNFFCRQAECVELGCGFAEQSAFKDIELACGRTDNVQIICNNFNTNNSTLITGYDTNIIRAADLDLESAAHPDIMTHTIYGSVAYRWDDRDYPVFAGVGGSFEFAHDNTGMDKWMLWGKFGFSF